MSRTRRFNAKLNYRRQSLSKEDFRSSQFRNHLMCLCGWRILLIREIATIRINSRPIRHFSVLPKTRCRDVKPSYCWTWEFKCNIPIAEYSRRSTGLICLWRHLCRQCPGPVSPLEIARDLSDVVLLGGIVLSFLFRTDAQSMRDFVRAPAAVLRPMTFARGLQVLSRGEIGNTGAISRLFCLRRRFSWSVLC